MGKKTVRDYLRDKVRAVRSWRIASKLYVVLMLFGWLFLILWWWGLPMTDLVAGTLFVVAILLTVVDIFRWDYERWKKEKRR